MEGTFSLRWGRKRGYNNSKHWRNLADSLDTAIHHHAHVQVERIIAYPHVAEKIAQGKLLVQQAYYDVTTGKVTF